jgi:hypothetical protein
MSQAAFTLTSAEDRTATSTVSDVTTVRITGTITVDHEAGTLSFRYEKGRIVGSSFVQDSLSDLVSVTDANAIAAIFNATVADGAESVRYNLERALLQYLEDQGTIAAGDF